MFLSTLLLLPLLPLSLGFADPELHARSRSRAHQGVLSKRQGFGGRATFYDVGLGACGGYNVASDFIVALNSPQFGGGYPGPNCGRALTISYGGKTTTAIVRDQCPGCGYGDLDMSRGLFNFFASEDKGTFQMSWSWADSPAQAPAPATTQSPTPSPTPAYTPPPPTSTYTPPPPTTSTTPAYTPSTTSTTPAVAPPSSTTASSTPLSASASGSVSASGSGALSSIGDVINSAAPTASGAAGTAAGSMAGAGNLVKLNQAVANLGRVVVVSAQL